MLADNDGIFCTVAAAALGHFPSLNDRGAIELQLMKREINSMR
jgi:hypothetical protein